MKLFFKIITVIIVLNTTYAYIFAIIKMFKFMVFGQIPNNCDLFILIFAILQLITYKLFERVKSD